jgi:hypothetical protein
MYRYAPLAGLLAFLAYGFITVMVELQTLVANIKVN